MMNKKAIAAFAAGATLLAGFAMATPAMAEVKADGTLVKNAALTTVKSDDSDAVKGARYSLTQAYTAYETAKTKFDGDNTAIDAYKEAKPEYKNYSDAALKAQAEKDKTDQDATLKGKAVAYLAAVDSLATDAQALDSAKNGVASAEDHVVELTKPAPDSKRSVLAKLDDAKEKLDKAQEAKDKAFAEADAAFNAKHEAENSLKSAQRALKDYQDENAKDKGSRAYNAEVARLTKEINEAKEALSAAKTKFNDADKAFKEAAGKFAKALTEYAGAYKNAQLSKADVSAYPTPASLAPLATDYKYGVNFVPSATVQPGKPGAKPGKPGAAQPGKAGAANGAAAAGAKTEVENKNGKDKRGNTHTGTGVGVTLTALAATMLAGMGAAVRKARH
ncbi:hypothetical protein HXT23_06070 [Gardnerella sp. DNF00257]|uniref:hypothetical protein n=1 Tax=Gardnerella sp. DNF00257 TaxID=2749045 RepID=UPI001968761B